MSRRTYMPDMSDFAQKNENSGIVHDEGKSYPLVDDNVKEQRSGNANEKAAAYIGKMDDLFAATKVIDKDYVEGNDTVVFETPLNDLANEEPTSGQRNGADQKGIQRPLRKEPIKAVFKPNKPKAQSKFVEPQNEKAQKTDPRDISLYSLEKKLKASGVMLEVVFGKYSYFNGRNFVALSEKMFCALCKEKLDKETQSRIMQMRTLKDLYEYATLCGKEREKTEIQENFLVSFTNGVVDLRSMKLFKHSSAHKVSFTVDANCILANSLEAAYQKFSSTTTYEFLMQMVDGDQESIRLVMQMVGFLLLNVTPKRAFFWLGPAPASGKSVLMELIRRLIGSDVVCHIDAHRMGEKFSLAQLSHSRVNLGLDSGGKLSSADVSAIKTLSGDPVMSIERKFREREDYLNFTKLVFASNESLDICESDVSDAVWDRIKLIVCFKSCDEQARDPYLIDKLWEERDTLMAVVIQETHALIHDDFRFVEPAISRKMKHQWRYASENPVASFIRERLEITDYEGSFISTNELLQEFVQYTGAEPMACNVFSNLLSRYAPKDLISKKGNDSSGHRVRGFTNIRLHDDEE